jgi:hypothetical protein
MCRQVVDLPTRQEIDGDKHDEYEISDDGDWAACRWHLDAGVPVLGQERVPLIDRDLFFGDPEIGGAQISPDGRFIAFVKPFQGTRNIWVKGLRSHLQRGKADHQRHEAADPGLLLES